MINQNIQNIKNIIPKYWPIGSFIHHNPLTGFEDKNFKEGLELAKNTFGGQVYMKSSYYVKQLHDKKIDESVFNKNLKYLLKKHGFDYYFNTAKEFLLNVSPDWRKFGSLEKTHNIELDEVLFAYLQSISQYKNDDLLFESLVGSMNLYELNDALFDLHIGEIVQKEIIEYITRYLDEEQTTLTMYYREEGMFQTFKSFESFKSEQNAQEYIEAILDHFNVPDKEQYMLTHLLRLSGWSGFIRYRSSSDDYYFQQEHPSSVEDFIAVILYYENKHIRKLKISTYDDFKDYYKHNKSRVILKLLQYQEKLDNIAFDLLEHSKDYDAILKNFRERMITEEALQIQASLPKKASFENNVEYAKFVSLLQKEEGYLWLKSLEDTYIEHYIDDLIAPVKKSVRPPKASAVFCIDVRSEILRRHIEQAGSYSTYGMAGFLGIPISFIEFDKGHEQHSCPAVVKPSNMVFELPKDEHDEYKKQKGFAKTFKKVLYDLKNNPYSPFIMVEAIGWIFGIKLFGKTFLPKKTEQFFSKFRPTTPQTTYTIDPLTPLEVEIYSKKLHLKIIKDVLDEEKGKFRAKDVEEIWEHLIFEKELTIAIDENILHKLVNKYFVTHEDFLYQKSKLASVGFELETQIDHAQRILKTMGLTSEFPEFVFMIAHNSISDNNPFESALDCGACGGNASLPNIRAFVMMINKKDVRDGLKERGINIPDYVTFVPAMHNTTTDEIDVYPNGVIKPYQQSEFNKVVNDFKIASQKSRIERMRKLPHARVEDDVFVKSMDWSETRPEWGLAGNIMAYVGNREATKNINLQNKVFLQSYKWEEDNEEADILTQLYDGPLVVGEWINMEHYFSTVDNNLYGAGSKVYHNIVSKVGVFYGNYSDLKIGLPAQTVLLEGDAYHDPMRLIVFLEAPLEYGLKAVERSTMGAPIILNEWIRLVVIDKRAGKVYMFEDGQMKEIRQIG